MAESRAVLRHLLRGTEELLRAASEALATLRERSEDAARPEDATPDAARGKSEGGAGSLEDTARRLADDLASWLAGGESHALDELRSTLRKETRRWDLRAGEDPAARRVHDLFALLLEMLGDERPKESRPKETAPKETASGETAQSAPDPADQSRASERSRPPRRTFTPRPSERK